MGTRHLADTNVIIDLVTGRLPLAATDWLEAQLNQNAVVISVVTRIELLTKTEPAAEYATMQDFVRNVDVLPLDEMVVAQTIALRQRHRVKLPDAIIAATALAHGLALVSRNGKDFAGVVGLAVVNPHDAATLPTL